MKFTKENLLNQIFKLYLLRGYSDVSISTIQEDLGIGRATLYYHFKDKETMFKAVIDKFLHENDKAFDVDGKITLEEFIKLKIRQLTKLRDAAKSIGDIDIVMTNFGNLLMVSMIKYPEYRGYARRIKIKMHDVCRKALKNSIKEGTIRPDIDIDVLAMMFTNIKDAYEAGLSVSRLEDESFFVKSYTYLYDLIKVRTTKLL